MVKRNTWDLEADLAPTSILVVEPPGAHQDHLTNTLAGLGCEARVVASAADLPGRLDDQPPDLVLLDDQVNDLTLEDLLDHLQARDMDAFVVMMSAAPVPEESARWVMAGAFAFLQKPVDARLLEEVIARGLANKEAYQQVVDMAQDLTAANEALRREKQSLKELTELLRFLYDLQSDLAARLDLAASVQVVSEALLSRQAADMVVFLTKFSPDEPTRLLPGRPLHRDLAEQLGRELARQLDAADAEAGVEIAEAPKGRPPMFERPGYRIILPLTAAGRTYGLMGAYFLEEPNLTGDRLMLFKSVSFQSAQVLYNAYQHRRAVEQAAHDPLTGLLNRRSFDVHLHREFERCQRYKTETALLMIDLDHFKAVNDRHGHHAGDQVLIDAAAVIQEAARATDIVGRWGGEEFMVLMPNTNQEDGARLARRIADGLAEKVWRFNGRLHRQTASQGVADASCESAAAAEDLIRLADQAMYLAKQEGRNTIRQASQLPELAA